MKILSVLFILLISCISLSLFAQSHFAPLHAEWKYEGPSFDCSGYHQKLVVTEELVLHGKDCSKIKAYLWINSIQD